MGRIYLVVSTLLLNTAIIGIATEPLPATSIKYKWDMANGVVRSAVFSPDGNTLAIACGNEVDSGEIRLYSMKDGTLLHKWNAHKGPISCLAYATEDQLLSGGRDDSQCLIWNTISQKTIGSLNSAGKGILDISVSRDAKRVFTAGSDHSITEWELKSRKNNATIETDKTVVLTLSLSPTGKWLVGAGYSEDDKGAETIRVWEVGTNKEVAKLKWHTEAVTGLAFSPNGKQMVSCSRDGFIIIWDTKTWTNIGEINQGKDTPISLAFSLNGKCLAIGSWSGEVSFHNVSKQAQRMVLQRDILQTRASFWVHDLPVTAVAFRPGGNMLVSGGLDGKVKALINLPEFE